MRFGAISQAASTTYANACEDGEVSGREYRRVRRQKEVYRGRRFEVFSVTCRGPSRYSIRKTDHHLRGGNVGDLDLGDHIQEVLGIFQFDWLGLIYRGKFIYRKTGLEQPADGVQKIARPVAQV